MKRDYKFAESVVLSNTNLQTLSYDTNRVLARDKGAMPFRLHYFYKVDNDTSFHFNLISEVRKEDAEWFEKELETLNLKIEQAETETDYFDVATILNDMNSINGYDDDVYNTSLGKAIRTVAHPFETLQDKIDCVNKKWNEYEGNLPHAKKVEAFKSFFTNYYENPEFFNLYGLRVIEPF